MKEVQLRMAEFNTKRGWDKDSAVMKDFLLNLCEEATEAWTIIKWVDAEKQKVLMKEHKDKFEDFIGDSLFIIHKIAWLLDIDPQKALDDTFAEYEQRFPAEKTKAAGHGNPLAGGIDDKENSKR